MANTRNNLALFLVITVSFALIEETTQLPDYVWQMLKDKNITSTSDFIVQMLGKKPSPDLPGPPDEAGSSLPGEEILYNEEGTLNPGGGDIIASLVDIEKDKCEIKRVSHTIPPPVDEPNVIFWPCCVKINKCSGCCNNEMLECSPVLEQSVEYSVLQARYPFPGADYFEFQGLRTMLFKQHLECECRCRVQPEDCVPGLHLYDPHACQCQCYNHMDSLSCVHPMIWNNNLCRCACPPNKRACYDDEEFSEDSCSCVPIDLDIGLPPSDFTSNGDIYCATEIQCRVGYRAEMGLDGECQCVMDLHSNLEGSLITGSRPTRRPRPPSGAADIEKVPDHPMYVVHNTPAPTRAPRPPRRTRRPRRPHN